MLLPPCEAATKCSSVESVATVGWLGSLQCGESIKFSAYIRYATRNHHAASATTWLLRVDDTYHAKRT
ncbi:hypothetical protein BH11PSE13_BH11PSE13_19020 [soil metagenome]